MTEPEVETPGGKRRPLSPMLLAALQAVGPKRDDESMRDFDERVVSEVERLMTEIDAAA